MFLSRAALSAIDDPLKLYFDDEMELDTHRMKLSKKAAKVIHVHVLDLSANDHHDG